MKINKKEFYEYVSENIESDISFFKKKSNAVDLMTHFSLPFHKNFLYSIKIKEECIYFSIKYKTRIKDTFLKQDIVFQKTIEYNKKDIFLDNCKDNISKIDFTSYLEFYNKLKNYISFQNRINKMIDENHIINLNKKTDKMNKESFDKYILSFFGENFLLPAGTVIENGNGQIFHGKYQNEDITINNPLIDYQAIINLNIMTHFPKTIENNDLNIFEKKLLKNKEIIRNCFKEIRNRVNSDLDYRKKMLKNKIRSEEINIEGNSVEFKFSSSRQMKSFLDSLKKI